MNDNTFNKWMDEKEEMRLQMIRNNIEVEMLEYIKIINRARNDKSIQETEEFKEAVQKEKELRKKLMDTYTKVPSIDAEKIREVLSLVNQVCDIVKRKDDNSEKIG